jgi:methylglutaconyl-CoA hydratase
VAVVSQIRSTLVTRSPVVLLLTHSPTYPFPFVTHSHSHSHSLTCSLTHSPSHSLPLNDSHTHAPLKQTAVNELVADPTVRVIVLTGSGKYFCTGMDLGVRNQTELRAEVESGRMARDGLRLFDTLRRCGKPVIAAANGSAFGGGWGLLFTADFRLAVRSASFAFSEVRRGIVPALISSFIVPQLGRTHSARLMLSGERISAAEALRLGALTQVCEDAQALRTATARLVSQLLLCAPRAMSEIKRLVAGVAESSAAEGGRLAAEVFGRTVQGEEARYGVACFLQKQTPDWSSLPAKL